MATLASMNKYSSSHPHDNRDNEKFEITVEIFETPEEYDHWISNIKVSSEKFGNLNFVCYLIKESYSTFEYAKIGVHREPLSRVKSILDGADGNPFPRNMYTSPDGSWMLF